MVGQKWISDIMQAQVVERGEEASGAEHEHDAHRRRADGHARDGGVSLLVRHRLDGRAEEGGVGAVESDGVGVLCLPALRLAGRGGACSCYVMLWCPYSTLTNLINSDLIHTNRYGDHSTAGGCPLVHTYPPEVEWS
jgi:hypothetical protein